MAVTPQTNTTLEEIAKAVQDAHSFMITGHVNPDGDCIGSQLALGCALEECGKSVTYLLAEDIELDGTLSFMPGAEKFMFASKAEGPCDVFIAVDVPTVERMGKSGQFHATAKQTITIDHHANDERVSDLAYVDPDSASASILIWRLVNLLVEKAPKDAAQCCYAGLMSDTGSFAFQNTDANAFEAAAQMVAAGADPAYCAQEMLQNRTMASLKLEALTIEHARFSEDGQVVVSWVSQEDCEKLDATKADAEPLIDILRSIHGVRLACMLRGQDGAVRGSLRAKDDTDVAVVARRHNGGGHKAAAGFRMQGSIEDVAEQIVEELEAEIR